jgi:uncharacterized protein YndB with AHSA1/START domain
MAKVGPIRKTYYYEAPPERVFASLTVPKELTKWFLASATLTPRKGGSFRFKWLEGDYVMNGKVLDFDRPRGVRYAWIDRFGSKVFKTEVTFALTPKGKGTMLRVTHRGFKSGKKWVALYGGIQSGWTYYLLNLKSVLEHGTDLRSKHTTVA